MLFVAVVGRSWRLDAPDPAEESRFEERTACTLTLPIPSMPKPSTFAHYPLKEVQMTVTCPAVPPKSSGLSREPRPARL